MMPLVVRRSRSSKGRHELVRIIQPNFVNQVRDELSIQSASKSTIRYHTHKKDQNYRNATFQRLLCCSTGARCHISRPTNDTVVLSDTVVPGIIRLL